MVRVTSLFAATALSFAFASSAFACGMKNSASHEISPIASIEEKKEEAMTTFDPKQVPTFETEADVSEETLEELVEKKVE